MGAHAAQFLESARESLAASPPRLAVALDEARTAAELAGKALLLLQNGSYPKVHAIGGDLYHSGLIPQGVDAKRLSRLLRAHTRGEYGYHLEFSVEEAQEAIQMAHILLTGLQSRL